MKVIAIDYGAKRCGVAATDDLQIIASPLKTVLTNEIFAFLSEYFSKNKVERIVLGEPKRMDGSETHATPLVKKFADDFQKRWSNIPINWVDERFTSAMAKQAILASGVNKKSRQDKALIDEVSATIILQSYLSQK